MARRPHRTRNRFVLRLALLAGLALALYAIGADTVGMWDRDEPWYAQIAREMVASGDWVVPRYLGVVFVGKPVFSFWCSALALTLFGDTMWAARLPSALAMVATIVVLTLSVARLAGRRRALWTGFILATTVLAIALAKIGLTDAILLLWITIAQLALFALYRGRGGWLAVVALWIAVGLAVLTKGPVVLGVQSATVACLLALDVGAAWRSPRAWLDAARWWPRARPWIGVFIAAAVVLPWMVLIQHRAPGFLSKTWLQNMYGPIAHTALEGHGGPPGYYLLMIWPMFLPWSLLLPLAIVSGWANRRRAAVRFSLAAVIGPWLVIELVRQKLPHYLLPLFPFLAFITADALVRSLRGQCLDLIQPRFVRAVAVWGIVMVAAGFAPFLLALPTFGANDLPWAAMIAQGVGAIAYAGVVFRLWQRRRMALAATVMGAGLSIGTAFLFGVVLPRLESMRLSQRCADVLLAHGALTPGDDDVATLTRKVKGGKEEGYKEPSLTYELDGDLDVTDADLLHEPPASWPTWLVMSERIWSDAPDASRLRLRRVASIRGLNYGGGGRMIDLVIAKKVDVAPPPLPPP